MDQVRENRSSRGKAQSQHSDAIAVEVGGSSVRRGEHEPLASAGSGKAPVRAGEDALAARGSRTLAQRITRGRANEPLVIPHDAPDRFLGALRQQLGEERFDRYARGRLELVFSAGGLRVNATSRALADLLRRRFMTELHTAAEQSLGRGVAITVDANELLAPTPLAPMSMPLSMGAVGEVVVGEAGVTAAMLSAEEEAVVLSESQGREEDRPGGASASELRGRSAQGLASRLESGASGASGALRGKGKEAGGNWSGTLSRPPKTAMLSRHRLEDFIVGQSNRLAYNAALQIAEGAAGPGETEASLAYSMLFVHGPCGVGKTHLVQGIALRFRERFPGAVVRVTSGEAFITEFVSALRAGGTGNEGPERFRKSYRRVDLLVIDDVQALANKTATQVELLHTFEEITRGGARIVLASDQHPRQLEKFSPQLISRFLAGMVAGVSPPDEELTRRLIKTLSQKRGLILDEPGIAAVASRARLMPGAATGLSVREIEGIVTRLEAVHKLLPDASGASRSGAINLLTIERAIGNGVHGGYGDAMGERAGRGTAGAGSSGLAGTGLGGTGLGMAGGVRGVGGKPIRMEAIIAQTCRYLSVDPGDLAGRTRHKRVVLARAVITHLARQFTTMSYPEIARAIGRPNHSTVITAYQRLAEQIAANETLGVEHVPEPMSVKSLIERLSAAVMNLS